MAISPDGAAIACGGWTQIGSDTGHTIYLFNRATGSLTGRITGLPNVIGHLAFSPDCRYLVATLGGDDGIRLYAVGAKEGSSASPGSGGNTGKGEADKALASPLQVGEDKDYGDRSYSPDTSGVQDGDLDRVAWSADGCYTSHCHSLRFCRLGKAERTQQARRQCWARQETAFAQPTVYKCSVYSRAEYISTLGELLTAQLQVPSAAGQMEGEVATATPPLLTMSSWIFLPYPMAAWLLAQVNQPLA